MVCWVLLINRIQTEKVHDKQALGLYRIGFIEFYVVSICILKIINFSWSKFLEIFLLATRLVVIGPT